MRGALTPAIQQIAKDKIGREISLTELRLIPYVQYVMLNNQRLDAWKINQEEREILAKWKEKDWVAGGAGGLSVSKEFYDLMCEILWEGYVVGGATQAWVAVKSGKEEPMFTDERTERMPSPHKHVWDKCSVPYCKGERPPIEERRRGR